MARTITSDVGGRTLEIPTARDLFEIVAGGMPNGDDCLGLTNDTSGLWYAHDRNATPLVPTATGTGTGASDWTFNMWVQKGDCANVTTTTWLVRIGKFNTSSISAADQLFGFRALATGNPIFDRLWGRFNDGSAVSSVSTGWSMYTLSFDNSVGTYGTLSLYRNGALVRNIAATDDYAEISNTEFSIGLDNVALTSTAKSWARDASPATRTLIGKIAVWRSRALTAIEIANLYAAM